ncbi:MAG: hypothetical protein NTV46_06655, partial [Verrucomicrobia bacterium]|nr:hypothetical protein [Verrucomicrobiota bacterium]
MTKKYWHLIGAFLLSAAAHSQDAKPSAAALSVRAFLHDPSHGVVELYVKDVKGNVVKLCLTPGEIGKAQAT